MNAPIFQKSHARRQFAMTWGRLVVSVDAHVVVVMWGTRIWSHHRLTGWRALA